MKLIAHSIGSSQVRIDSLAGKDHYVLPVVMMVEGVHSGSAGPILYQAPDLAQHAERWSGMPVTVNHPQDKKGNPISANIPDTAQTIIGRVYNSRFEGGKLKAEAWIPVEGLETIAPEVYEFLNEEKPIEVSIGVYSVFTEEAGMWNETEYLGIATDLRPDHLALLPGGEGACNWDKGCGIRVNHKNKKGETNVKKDLKELISSFVANTMATSTLTLNEVEYTELVDKLYSLINRMDSDMYYYYLEGVYEGYLIFCKKDRDRGIKTHLKQSYSINEDGTVELTGEAEKVRKEVSFIAVNNKETQTEPKMKRTKINNKVNKMENATPCSVDALIKNQASQFSEEDREWLSGLSQERLDKLVPKEVKEPVTNSKPVEISDEDIEKRIKKIFNENKDPLSFIDNYMPEGLKGQMKTGLKMYEEKRNTLIKEIVANSKFVAEKLEKWNDEDLQSLRDSVVPTDFTGLSDGFVSNHSTEDQGSEDHIKAMINHK